jgi:hypothetical protein
MATAWGCATLATLATVSPGRGVDVVRLEAWTGGRGAVIGPDRVLTVAHVVGGAAPDDLYVVVHPGGYGHVRARPVLRRRAAPESLVVLEVETRQGLLGDLLGFAGFAPGDRFAPGRGAPARIDTRRGLAAFQGAALEPGDSGSPILDAQGGLVGLLSGRSGGAPLYVPVTREALEELLGPAAADDGATPWPPRWPGPIDPGPIGP